MALRDAGHVALRADERLTAALRLNAVMVFLAQLALGARLAAPLDEGHHVGYAEAAEEAGLVVVGLFVEARRGEGVLEYHSSKLNDYRELISIDYMDHSGSQT